MTVYHRLGAALCMAAFLGLQPLAAQPPAPATAAPSARGTGPIPIADFAEQPFFSDPVLSPDGMHVAAKLQIGDDESIGIYDLGAPERRPRIISPGQFTLGSVRWAGDHRLLISVVGRTNFDHGSFYFPVIRVLSFDLTAGTSRVIGPNAGLFDRLIFVDPQARFALLASQGDLFDTPSVYRVDLESGVSTKVQDHRSGVWDWFADGNGVVRIGVDYTDRRTQIYYRPAADAPLRRLRFGGDLRDQSVIDSVHFLTTGDRGVVMTNAETGRFALYDYDFVNDARGAPIFERPDVDLTDVILAPDGSVDGVTFEDDRPRVHWLNASLERLQREIDGALPGHTNRALGRSSDGNRILIRSSAATDGNLRKLLRSLAGPSFQRGPAGDLPQPGRPRHPRLPDPSAQWAVDRTAADRHAARRTVPSRQLELRYPGPVPGKSRLCGLSAEFSGVDRLWP
jgi:hypothetical protein